MDGQSISTDRGYTNRFGVYVHTPFCVHKCSYCDFYSFTRYENDDFGRLFGLLDAEIGEARHWIDREKLTLPPLASVFLGGGTPSLAPVRLVENLLSRLSSEFGLKTGAEVTLEANPETVTPAFAETLSASQVNRVSLGAQSFQPQFLKVLERLGSARSIVHAVHTLRSAGMRNLSLDLIFAIPGQTWELTRDDLNRALDLEPDHMSWYNLTLKPGHPLYDLLPSSDEAAEIYERGVAHLEGAGMKQYEISNFAKPGRESVHNLLYWDGGDFLGLGPSSSSRFFFKGAFHHRKQVSDLALYAKSGFRDFSFERTDWNATVLEATFLELRKNRGISLEGFQRKYAYDLSKSGRFLLYEKEGLIAREGDRVWLTDRGRLLADSVTRDLAP